MARSSPYRGKLTEEGRKVRRPLMKREKNGSLRNTSTDSKGAACVILINHTSASIRKDGVQPAKQGGRPAEESV